MSEMSDDMVRVEWEVPPTQGADGSWYRTYTVVELPRHVAWSAHKPTMRVLDQWKEPDA
jgi:hypothetical protein